MRGNDANERGRSSGAHGGGAIARAALRCAPDGLAVCSGPVGLVSAAAAAAARGGRSGQTTEGARQCDELRAHKSRAHKSNVS